MAKPNLPTEEKAKIAVQFGKQIGAGCYREVYKFPRAKWVYKRDKFPSRLGNVGEYAAYKHLKANYTFPEGVKLPEMHMVGEYIAAEYVKGKHPKLWCSPSIFTHGSIDHDDDCTDDETCWAVKCNGIPINDLHNENVIITDDGTIYIIDIGHGSI